MKIPYQKELRRVILADNAENRAIADANWKKFQKKLIKRN